MKSAPKLQIRDTLYGPTIYFGRRKVEGPFVSRVGPHGAEGRMESIIERKLWPGIIKNYAQETNRRP